MQLVLTILLCLYWVLLLLAPRPLRLVASDYAVENEQNSSKTPV